MTWRASLVCPYHLVTSQSMIGVAAYALRAEIFNTAPLTGSDVVTSRALPSLPDSLLIVY